MCWPTDQPIVLVVMLTNSEATYWSIGYRHSANTSLIWYNIILCLLKFLFCPWFSLCSYGILCNLCTSQLSIGQCYRPILDRHFGWNDGCLLVAISADAQLTRLTLVGWLSVDMLVDGQIGGLCFFKIISFIPKYNNYSNYHKAYMHTRTTHLSTHAILQSLHDCVGRYVDR